MDSALEDLAQDLPFGIDAVRRSRTLPSPDQRFLVARLDQSEIGLVQQFGRCIGLRLEARLGERGDGYF